MTHEEIIQALERALESEGSPVAECFYTILPKAALAEAVGLIKYQDSMIVRLEQEELSKALMFNRTTQARIYDEAVKGTANIIEQIIVENTYPSFDKDGKPVNVWKAKEGYTAIEGAVKNIREYIHVITEEGLHESENTDA